MTLIVMSSTLTYFLAVRVPLRPTVTLSQLSKLSPVPHPSTGNHHIADPYSTTKNQTNTTNIIIIIIPVLHVTAPA